MGFIQNLGPLQLVLIVVVILVLFGVGKLPQVGKGVGQAISEFKAALNKSDKEDEPSSKEFESRLEETNMNSKANENFNQELIQKKKTMFSKNDQ